MSQSWPEPTSAHRVLAGDPAQEAVHQGLAGFCSKPLEGGPCQQPQQRTAELAGESARRPRDLSGGLVGSCVGISQSGPTPALYGASLQDSGWSVLVKREPTPKIIPDATERDIHHQPPALSQKQPF